MEDTLPTDRSSMRRQGAVRPQLGFTLLELIVAVVVVAILASIAYPTYVNQVIKGNRAAAQQFLLDVANAEAQYQLDARAFSATIGAGGLNLSVPNSVSPNYTIAVALTAGPPPGYVITATPIGRQAQDGALTLDDTGNKTPANKW
jgi:type IV pilus assembly protein PilE